MAQAHARSVFADPQFVQVIQLFDSLDTPFAVADTSGALFYSNASMKRLLKRLARDARSQDVTEWLDCSDIDPASVFSPQGEIDTRVLPVATRCRLASRRNPSIVVERNLRIECFSDGADPTELLFCFLTPPNRAARMTAEPGVLISDWLPRIEEIGDSFDVPRLGGKVCKLLEDLTNARAVAFYALRPARDDGLERVWRRAEQIGRIEYIADTPFELETGQGWIDSTVRHSPVDLRTMADVLSPPQVSTVPGWVRMGQPGVVLACRARGDVLGLAFIWTDSEPLAFVDMRHLLGLVGCQAAQAMDNARWFELTQQSETRSRELIESANALILGMDWRGSVTLWNGKAAEVFGVSSREVMGRPPFHLFGDEAAERNRARERFLAVLRDEQATRDFETAFVDRAGRMRYVEWTTSPIGSAQGAVLGLYAIGQDVTERRNLQAQMLQAQKNESVGTLARGVAHDFNNILNGINGFVYLLQNNAPDDEKRDRFLSAIRELTHRASGLTRQMQAYARQARPEKRTIDLNEVIRQSLELLRVSVPKHLGVEQCLDEDLDWVEADRSQIEQVVMNLCLNAVEAMPNGGRLTVGTDRYSHLPGTPRADMVNLPAGDYCRVRISDTGCGMSEEVRQRVFDPFYTTKKTGNGLGLSAVYGIVEGHRGAIRVDSAPGEGSCFTFYLPAVDVRRRMESNDAAPLRGGNETILVVDDEKGVLLLAEDILSALGYRVVVATDGEEAVNIFQERPDAIHLVVMDIAMPGLNGRAAAKAMRMLRPDLPVLFTSGFSDRAQVESLAEDGFHHFLAKPYAMQDFQAAVRDALDARAAIQT